MVNGKCGVLSWVQLNQGVMDQKVIKKYNTTLDSNVFMLE